MNSTSAAEYLRAFAPAGTPLRECLECARAASTNQDRVEQAAKALDL